jgi:hypothetical protein
MPKTREDRLRELFAPMYADDINGIPQRMEQIFASPEFDAYRVEQERELAAARKPKASSVPGAPQPFKSTYQTPPALEARLRKDYGNEPLNQSAGSVQIPQYMHNYIQELLGKARETASAAYEPYTEPRIAGYSPAHQEAKRKLKGSLDNAEFDNLRDMMLDRQVLGADNNSAPNQRIDSMLSDARKTASSTNPLYNEFTNPYQDQILQNLQDRSNRNLRENILPQISSSFISQGAYNSGKRNEMEARAARDLQDNLMGQQAQVMTQGHEKALNNMQLEQEKQMNLANLSGKNLQRQENSMRDYLKDVDNDQRQQIIRKEGLVNLEEQERQIDQRGLDLAYEDQIKAQDFPYLQQARFNEAIRGLPSTGHTFRSAQATPQQPQGVPKSAFSNAGDIGLTFASMMAANRHARGGHVGYATGGGVNPERDQLIGMAKDFIGGKHDLNPMWMGAANMFASSAANPRAGDQLGNMAQGLPSAVQGFTQAREHNTSKQAQGANLLSAIERSKQLEARHDENREFKKLELAARQGMHADHMNVLREKQGAGLPGGLAKQVKKFGDMGYQFVNDPETGELTAVPVKGIKEAAPKLTKAEEKMLQDSAKAAEQGQKIVDLANQLMPVYDKVKTGPATGAWLGNGIGSRIGRGFKNLGEEEDIQTVNAGSNKILEEVMALAPYRVTDAMLKQKQASKPGPLVLPEVNKKLTQGYAQTGQDAVDKDIFINDSLTERGISPKFTIPAYKKFVKARQEALESGKKFTRTPDDFLPKHIASAHPKVMEEQQEAAEEPAMEASVAPSMDREQKMARRQELMAKAGAQ